ncbi:MAG TPA: hypothetical protein EYG34_07950 [Acidimicrobiia bacterium]|jgi:aerobic-type carbon monoxide dehydrogenase small subunit (CoxS/CutS family)|nr:hypothetical protein [Acidimicrobiia bacterium]HIL47032.1 hypothetical protein [Acidimicrobiia bacterium]
MNAPPLLSLRIDGSSVEVPDIGLTLLEVLRDHCGNTTVKDGCSPQGQCGCCTVLVDGQARVACVTPARRVVGREITTLTGLPEETRQGWTEALCATGGTQCGFCTPGIIMRFADLQSRDETDPDRVARSLHAHLCRCTGWQTITESWVAFGQDHPVSDPGLATQRASLEGGTPQAVGPEVAAGQGGFSADTAPDDCLVAVPDGQGGWLVAESLTEARRQAGQIQGRRTTVESQPPLAVPPGDWAATLQTSWVDPAYLETDASWCAPGGEPSSPVTNGGAFGAKLDSPVRQAARQLADLHGRPVLVQLSREDAVRMGSKRPPLAAGLNADGQGRVRVARTPGITEAINAIAPGLQVEEVDLKGPPTSADLRAAGWAEAVALLAAATGSLSPVVAPNGAVASATVSAEEISLTVRCGDPLDAVVLRSYCIGAAHMAWSWVTSESLSVDAEGQVHDLTVRSFGVVRATEMPHVSVTIEPDTGPPVNGSDAVFAAVAAAVWLHLGTPSRWPTGLPN